MKIAPIISAIKKAQENGEKISYSLVHTGQHFDQNMSGSFFTQLGIPEPDINLECGGGSQAEQTANIMINFEKFLTSNPTDLVMVVGDVTSTLACSIVAKKLQTKVAHVEAGIRSGDMSMPEEINRMVTDSITDYFFTTSEGANHNLKKAGIEDERIFFVGNTMIDTLLNNEAKFQKPEVWNDVGLTERQYFVITLHRPANVDQEHKLKELMDAITQGSRGLPIIFPVHPRTAKNLQGIGISASNLFMIDPLGYLEFNYLVKYAKAVVTDSGGITEETTVMGVPCMTLRDNTERPETITHGTNELIGTDPKNLAPAFEKLFSGKWKKGSIPQLWDGQTSVRIIEHLLSLN
jgi:UDP-N-acetylglucosamine 2-epimerase (non-hydrolysing)